MKVGKATGPSGIVVEMIRAAGTDIISPITKLANTVVYERKIPNDWNLSYIVNCFKGKGDALLRGNYRGLKLLDQVLKVIERVLEGVIRSQVDINEMQFGFMPGRGTTDAIFILRQMHEKFLGKQKDLFFAFVDLEKAFDRVPRDVLWWSMRTALGVEKWVICVIQSIQSMYVNAKSSVRVKDQLSPEFSVKVGVHQGSWSSALYSSPSSWRRLSQDFRNGCPWELLYADDLVIMAESIDELVQRFSAWKTGLESNELTCQHVKN